MTCGLELGRRALQLAEVRLERGNAAYALALVGEAIDAGAAAEPAAAAAAWREAQARAEALQMAPLVAHCRRALGQIERPAR